MIYKITNFYRIFFNRKKIRKISKILRLKKIRKIRILDLWIRILDRVAYQVGLHVHEYNRVMQ